MLKLSRLLGREVSWGTRRSGGPGFDYYFVAYPKSGSTWLRLLLGRYVQLLQGLSEHPLFDGSEECNPAMKDYCGPRILFTHAPLEWEAQTADDLDAQNVVAPYRHARVVLLTRYPLDILVSHFMQAKYRMAENAFPGDLFEFIEDPVLGISKLLRFHFVWAAHYTEVRAFHLLRYEDLHSATAETVDSVLGFLGIEKTPDLVQKAVTYSSFENMRQLQLSHDAPVYRSSGLPIFGPIDATQPESFHVRRGQIGGYREYLDENKRGELERRIRGSLDVMYGYCEPPRED